MAEIQGFQYAYYHSNDKVEFMCTDEKVFNDVCDYIERYIDAERWRREPKQFTIHQNEKAKRY